MWMRRLAAVEAGAARGLIAAGYCAYELGYVFERRLQHLMPATGRPLLRFHLFENRQRLNARARSRVVERARARVAAIDGVVSPSLDEAGHRVKVERVRQLIGDGDVYQVNLTFKLRGARRRSVCDLHRVAREGAFGRVRVLALWRRRHLVVFAGAVLSRAGPAHFGAADEGYDCARPQHRRTTRGNAALCWPTKSSARKI